MPATITNLAFKGSQLIVKLKCQDGRETEWNSVGNLTSAASVLLSAIHTRDLPDFFT